MQLELAVDKQLPGFRLQAEVSTEAGILVLFGPSGSGKSLTLQCITGTCRPDQGRISIDGQPLFDSTERVSVPPQKRGIGYVPQSYALFPHMSVQENIGFGLRRQDSQQTRPRVASLIEMLGLAGLEKRHPHELSGGQQQRVALARALAIKPRLLLLDEPFSALDAAIRNVLRDDLLRIQRELGVNIILVTHGVVDTYTLADTVAIFSAGRILQVGRPERVFRHPSSPEVARLTGTSNLLSGTITEAGAWGCCVDLHGIRLRTQTTNESPGKKVLVAIRPEDAHLVTNGDSVAEDEEVVLGTVCAITPQGHLYAIEVRLGSTSGPQIHILMPVWLWRKQRVEVGSECTIAITRDSIHVLTSEEEMLQHETANTTHDLHSQRA